MGRMLKGDVDVGPLFIGVIILVGAMVIVFATLGIKYLHFKARFDENMEIKMEAVDVLHMVKGCMIRDSEKDLVDKGKLGECNEWSDEFNVNFTSMTNPDHSIYVATETGEIEQLYVKKK